MHVRLLGTAAGGAFPQWNCNCGNCRVARTNPASAKPRTQSCVAVSGDGLCWFLINASPDIRMQIESFGALRPPSNVTRGSQIAGVLLSNADLDHTLGLLSLRESGPVVVHATATVRRALVDGMNVEAILNCYGGLEWRDPPGILTRLQSRDGLSSGIDYAAFVVPGKPPRYRPGVAPSIGDAVGYRFVDPSSGGRLVVIPDLAAIDAVTEREIGDADMLLLDGTFFDENEMQQTGTGTASASEMGHVPVGGKHGSLAKIARLRDVKRIYIHLNNTNPMLREDSPEFAEVQAAGVMVGYDGMEFNL